VRVLLPGYQTRREQFSLSSGAASRTIAVQLQPDPATPPTAATAPAAGSAQPAAPAPAAAAGAGAAAVATGSLDIDSRPVGAQVFVDDRPVGTTPVRVPEMAPGSHIVRLELAGHRVWSEAAQVARGKATRVAGSLEPIR
jgi:PEGA domain